jgi:hypothetical protein
LAQKKPEKPAKGFPRKEFAAMAKAKNKGEVIVRISVEDGIPRVRPLTAGEQRQFLKTHPKSKLPTYSLGEIERMVNSLEQINRITDPKTMSVVTRASAG